MISHAFAGVGHFQRNQHSHGPLGKLRCKQTCTRLSALQQYGGYAFTTVLESPEANAVVICGVLWAVACHTTGAAAGPCKLLIKQQHDVAHQGASFRYWLVSS
jgi:hypothetical protein